MKLQDVLTYSECSSILSDKDDIRRYVLQGKGVVTLKSPSGKHHSYFFKKPVYEASFPEGTRFVYTLGTSSIWHYTGMLEPNHKIFRPTFNSYYSELTEEFKGAKFIVKMMNKDMSSSPMMLYHEGVCAFCGRKLTNPKSLKTGFGPKCYKKVMLLELV